MKNYFKYLLMMLVSIPAIALADFEHGVKDLAKQISKQMIENSKKKIAVIEFSDLNDQMTLLGQYLPEELITQLFINESKKYELVERRQIQKVLQQQGLGTSGLLDADAMGTVGNILGIDAIVTGSITDLGNKIKVNARLISVDTAKIFAVATTTMPKEGIVANLMEKIPATKSDTPRHTMAKTQSESNIPSSGKGVQSIDTNDFTFNLVNCTKNSGDVSCKLVITNNGKEKSLLLFAANGKQKSRLYDSQGKAYSADKITLASRKPNPRAVRSALAFDVPTSASVSFKDIPEDVDTLTVVAIKALSSGTFFEAQFRNVAISQKN